MPTPSGGAPSGGAPSGPAPSGPEPSGLFAPVVPRLEPLFFATVEVGPVQDLGVTAAGHRRVVPIIGGRVDGALAGEVLPGGADWQIVRRDGTVEVSARYTLRLDSGGTLIQIDSRGLRTGPPGVVEALLAGAPVDPSEYYFRLVIALETSAPDLAWLQTRILVASAIRTASQVQYQAYSLT